MFFKSDTKAQDLFFEAGLMFPVDGLLPEAVVWHNRTDEAGIILQPWKIFLDKLIKNTIFKKISEFNFFGGKLKKHRQIMII